MNSYYIFQSAVTVYTFILLYISIKLFQNYSCLLNIALHSLYFVFAFLLIFYNTLYVVFLKCAPLRVASSFNYVISVSTSMRLFSWSLYSISNSVFFFELLNYVFLRVHSFCMNVPQFDVISLPTYSAVLLFMLTIYYQHFLSFVLNMC